MLSKSLNPQPQKELSFPTYKYINKIPQNQMRYNTRYVNVQNKSSAPVDSNIYNNQILYKSENKKGYNQMTLPTFSKNTEILLINPNTHTNISKGKKTILNSLNWNNIGFKEVKYKNNFSNKTYNNNLMNSYNLNNRNDLFKSYNDYNNYGATAHNLGFYNINSSINSNLNSNTKKNGNKNLLYSKKTGLNSSHGISLTKSYNNNLNNNINNNRNFNPQKNTLYEYYKNIIQIKNAREGINSKVIKNRMTDEQNIKKINKIQAVWKGIYVRGLMSYYWNFCKFQDDIEKILDNYYKKYFFNKLRNKVSNEKQIEKDKLIEEYNNVVKQFNEYKQSIENNKNKAFNIEKMNFEINSEKIINSEQFISNEEKEKENIKLKAINKIKDDDLLNHYNKKLNIINNDNIFFEKIKKENKFEINNTFFSLINNETKEKPNISENINNEKNKIFTLESQKGFSYEEDKAFKLNDLSIEKNRYLDIIGKNSTVKQEQDEKKNIKPIYLISNKTDFEIKKEEKQKYDKTTETTEEMDMTNINNTILTKENEIVEYKINKRDKTKAIKDYNSVNEIEKGDGLEINPYEIKRTKINTINQQNNINIFASNNTFNEKAKKNLMKMIFPIKLKEVLLRYIKKKYFSNLINELKKISFSIIMMKIKLNNEKRLKKIGMEKLKEKVLIIKIKKYFEIEMGKYQLQSLAKNYLFYKWNKGLLDLSNIIISNNKK